MECNSKPDYWKKIFSIYTTKGGDNYYRRIDFRIEKDIISYGFEYDYGEAGGFLGFISDCVQFNGIHDHNFSCYSC